MKQIYILIAALLLCSGVSASMEELDLYTIRGIVWDIEGDREADVAVTFSYDGISETLYSAEDGTVAFNTLNFGKVPDGAEINVSCKYGAKDVLMNYEYGATGITFNEPSEAAAIDAWAAMGLLATAVGGGIYWLRRKIKGGE